MPSYKLNYFNGRGRAEITRLIFAAAGAELNDNRISDWPAAKPAAPLGQLPYFEVDGVSIPQSIAIARFAAREFNLAGSNNLQQAQADAIVDTVIELVNYYYSNVFNIKDEAEKAEAIKKFLAERGAQGAANIEKLITLYGSNGYSVGNSLTWADLIIYDVTVPLFSKHPNFQANYPKIAQVHQTVSSNERIAEYVRNRPETPF